MLLAVKEKYFKINDRTFKLDIFILHLDKANLKLICYLFYQFFYFFSLFYEFKIMFENLSYPPFISKNITI